MNWLENYVRPRIQAFVSGNHSDKAENKWQSCPNCSQMLFLTDLPKHLFVCSECGHHLRMPAHERLRNIFDEGYVTIEEADVVEDPLKFRDEKRYIDRLKASRSKVGSKDVVQTAYGTINGEKAVVAVFDFRFMGGSMGSAAGAALVQAARRALAEQCGMIVFTSSGGARMQEGIISLMQLPRSVAAIEMLREASLPYIVVLCDPTTGGVSASFAMLGDVHIAEPGATIGFAGRRVIEQTVRETLPESFQLAEELIEKGVIDMIVKRKDLKERLHLLLRLLNGRPKTSPEAVSEEKSTENEKEETLLEDNRAEASAEGTEFSVRPQVSE